MTKVLVIGGGPGGATAATLLAQSGCEVELLEKERFPRYHIGESLASSCRALLKHTGAAERIDTLGFPVKTGGLFRWGAESDWIVDWSELFTDDASSWQVNRAEFDNELLEHAREQGVVVNECANVRSIEFEGKRPVSAQWSSGSDRGASRTSRFDFLIDASGRAGIVSTKYLKNRSQHEIFQNVAIWGYWKGVKLLPDTPSGGINIVSHPRGWYWVIPLKDGEFSIGFVTHRDLFREDRARYYNTTELYLTYLSDSPTIAEQVSDTEFGGRVRVEQDYSYVADSFCGPGYYLVGDAACFLDPLLSTGVHLALYSSTLAAAAILSEVRNEIVPSQAQSFYESMFRGAYARLLSLVSGVYEKYAGKRNYFWLAHELVHEKDRLSTIADRAAFVELVAGLSDLQDAVAGRFAESTIEMIDDSVKTRSNSKGHSPIRITPEYLQDSSSGLQLVLDPLGVKVPTPLAPTL